MNLKIAFISAFVGGLMALWADEPRDLSFLATQDQGEQRYVLVLPELFESQQPHDLLICLHGHGADRWQFIQDNRGETRAARDMARQYRLILATPDYRAPTSWMGPAAEADLAQLITHLKQQHKIRRVLLAGASMGAASALTFTALHPDLVDGVIALNGLANHLEYKNFQEAIQASFGGNKETVPEEYKKRSAELFPNRFTMPVAITAGGQDTVVPPHSVLRLGEAIRKFNPFVQLDFQESRGHNTEYEASLAAFDFVLRTMNAKAARVSVRINGKPVLPASGSVAGVWFYADGSPSAQLLVTGHSEVPGSWRLTASLNADDEVQLRFTPEYFTNVQYQVATKSPGALSCLTATNALVIRAGSSGGTAVLTQFTWQNAPVCFVPERRPISRDPVVPSPDPHLAIANSLVEWDWRMQDGIQTPRESRTYRQALEKLLRQTEAMLAERRQMQTLPAELEAAWDRWRSGRATVAADEASSEALWLQLHQLRRQIVLANPAFQLSELLFVKHVPSIMSHQLTQVYGYCARPGGGLFVLTQPGTGMRTRELTPKSLPPGNFMTPEVSYDAQKVLFAYCPVKEAPASWDYTDQNRHLKYHIHELLLADGTVRQLTRDDADNVFPVYLPSGKILFVSTRRGGYHRCGRGPCFVYTLARMEQDGADPQSISFHETHEWDPSVLSDGRIVYTRWDYVDRNAVHYQHLWATRPDGSGTRAYYGNNTWNPTGIWEARAIPGSERIMATAGPHHAMTAGSIIRLDTTFGVDGQAPITRLTPEVRFPESESALAMGSGPGSSEFDALRTHYWRSPLTESWMEKNATEEEKRWPGHCYKSPWPLTENYFLVSYSYDTLVGELGPNIPNMFGLYYADAFGNKELIYRDPAISSLWARPLAPRPVPPDLTPPVLEAEKQTGTFFLSDVKESWPELPAQTAITHLRIVQVLLKTTPNADTPRVGAAFAAPGKQVLGTVPVEADGSAYFEVPARTPVQFQALNAGGRAVQTMRSLVYLQPGENESCVGCHEQRMKTAAPQTPALALQRAPSSIKPGPDGSLPFSYPRLVQPVLDRHCVRCHDGQETKRSVLTGETEGDFTKSYNALVNHVSYSAWNRPEQNYEPLTTPLRFGALGSPLSKMLDAGHYEIRLSPEDQERLNTWMDANALFYGTFDSQEQKKQLAGQLISGPSQ